MPEGTTMPDRLIARSEAKGPKLILLGENVVVGWSGRTSFMESTVLQQALVSWEVLCAPNDGGMSKLFRLEETT
jgi:hypothetical protein